MSNGGPPNTVGTNNQPPNNNGSVERRLTALELRLDAVFPTLPTKADLVEILSNFATKADLSNCATKADVSHLATRADIETLRGEMYKMNAEMKTWGVRVVVALVGLMFAAFFGISQRIKTPAPQQLQPIIIYAQPPTTAAAPPLK